MDNYRDILKTGIPSGAAAALALGGTTRQPLVHGQVLRPGRYACGGFGAAWALGTWMMIDGDYRNGAGFMAVWSTLYLMSQRGALFRGAYPATLGLLAASNALGYALEFTSAPPALTNNIPTERTD